MSALDEDRRARLEGWIGRRLGEPGLGSHVALTVADALGIASRQIEAALRSAAAEAPLLGGDPAPSPIRAIRSGARDADPALHRAVAEVDGVAAAVWKPIGGA